MSAVYELRSIYLAARNHAVVATSEETITLPSQWIACGREPRAVGPIYLDHGDVECRACLRFLNRVGLPHALKPRSGSPPKRR